MYEVLRSAFMIFKALIIGSALQEMLPRVLCLPLRLGCFTWSIQVRLSSPHKATTEQDYR
jgi:hypothetical protein